MSNDVAPPPAYNLASVDSQPIDPAGHDNAVPEYTPLIQFTIGRSRTTAPLVSIPQIKGHLALLHAFAELRKQVEETEISLPNIPLDKDRKWAWFVALAVERFDHWCLAREPADSGTDASIVMPPIDVIMVWHSYMLNPRWYVEDTLRIPEVKRLKGLETAFKHVLEDPSSIFAEPVSAERQTLWEKQTSLPFDHIASAYELTKKTITCHMCDSPVEVDLMNENGTGYFQQRFSVACKTEQCSRSPITKEVLALNKLCRDICLTSGTGETINYIPGTLFPASSADLEKGRRVKTSFVDHAKTAAPKFFSLGLYEFGTPEYEKSLALGMMKDVRSLPNAQMRMNLHAGATLVSRIMSAYSNEKIYSVELVGAVLRQGTFVEKMYDLGWTRPEYFHSKEDELALHHALARYHAFIDLMSSSVGSFFVPTLDIDLVWHTHQLMPRTYDADCMQYLNRFVDHDDKVEGLRLSSAFDITCTAWKDRFKVQYTYCGCPLPGDTIGQRLSSIVGRYAPPPPSYLLPVDRADFLSATHPSDHNSVRFQAANQAAHRKATKRYEQLAKTKLMEREKALKKAEKEGKTQGGVPLGPHLQDARGRETRTNAYQYETAFLVPVPTNFGSAIIDGVEAGALLMSVEPLAGVDMQAEGQHVQLQMKDAMVVMEEGDVEAVAAVGVAVAEVENLDNLGNDNLS